MGDPESFEKRRACSAFLLLAARRVVGRGFIFMPMAPRAAMHTKYGNLLKSLSISPSSWLFEFSMHGVIFLGTRFGILVTLGPDPR